MLPQVLLEDIQVAFGLKTAGDQAGVGKARFRDRGGIPNPGVAQLSIAAQRILVVGAKPGAVQLHREPRVIDIVTITPREQAEEAIVLIDGVVDTGRVIRTCDSLPYPISTFPISIGGRFLRGCMSLTGVCMLCQLVRRPSIVIMRRTHLLSSTGMKKNKGNKATHQQIVDEFTGSKHA